MAEQHHSLDMAPSAAGGRFTAFGLSASALGGLAIGLLWAWWAEVAEGLFAPMILFPLLIGVGVGITMVGLVRIAQTGHRATIISSVVLAAVLAAALQHYFKYLDVYYWHQPAAQAVPGVAVAGDLSAAISQLIPSFADYMGTEVLRGRPLFFGYQAHGWVVWLTWVVDGLLTVAAAVAVTVPAMRTPYCDRCRSWYRVTRNGKIDAPTAKRLADLAQVVLPEQTRSRRYRLSNCHGGCSPTCCELSWEDSSGRLSLVQFWLDAAERAQVAAALDHIASETDDEAPLSDS